MSPGSGLALTTKRMVIGQVSVCVGCCCGRPDRGRPDVPVEWLKSEWRSRGLLKKVQLSVCGCLGPCDVPNVVKVSCASGNLWLGNITEFHQYRTLVDWAVESKNADQLLPLPREFDSHTLNPFRG